MKKNSMKKQLINVVYIALCISFSMSSMEQNNVDTKKILTPQEIIAHIAGYCRPREKNLLMKISRDFYTCLKNKGLILQANPATVSADDKIRMLAQYAYENNIPMMEFLLNNGVEANCFILFGVTPYHIACEKRYIEAMKLLVKHGANTNILKPQMHPLHEACYIGDYEMVKALLHQNVNPSIAFTNGQTPLHIASNRGYCSIIELLLDCGATVDYEDNKKYTALHCAVNNNHINSAELLLKAGANVNHANKDGLTSLYIASCYGYTEMAKLLIDYNHDVNRVSNDGYSALYAASQNGHTEIVQLLLNNAQTNIDYKNKFGSSALHRACYCGHTDIAQLLINAKAQLNYTNNIGCSPLCAAAYAGYVAIVTILLKNGASIYQALTADSEEDTLIKKGDTALTLAEKKGHVEVVKLLQEHMETVKLLEALAKQTQKESKEEDIQKECVVQ
jgi:ankyrin repeat protein